MSPQIHLLPLPLQHKIAAGEVVERPASALKELLENSIDAGATDITVELLAGGMDRISIADNGCGMSRQDMETAFQRYATSKLTTDDDLYRIGTYGFRGEALTSIAAVSEVTVETRQRGADSGTRTVVRASERTELGECGCAEGTSITVSKLFFNTPVRRKYLKSVTTEHRHSLDVFIDQALMYPERSLRLISNGKVLFDLRPESPMERMVSLLGSEWQGQMLPLDYDAVPYRIVGYVATPAFARESRRHQYLFVNRRRVEDHLISYRVKQAYSTLLDPRVHPPFVLDIQMPPELVDVNVHPRKAQVKFLQTNEVYHAVEEAVVSALQAHDLVPSARLALPELPRMGSPDKPAFSPTQQDFTRWDVVRERRPGGNLGAQSSAFVPSPESIETASVLSASAAPSTGRAPLYALAQLYLTYIVAEGEDGVMLIDQHAAQERMMFERLQKLWAVSGNLEAGENPLCPPCQGDNPAPLPRGEKGGLSMEIQQLLLPETIEFGPREAGILRESLELIRKFGIEIEEFGEQEFIVRAVPMVLAQAPVRALISGLVDELIEGKKGGTVDEHLMDRLAMRACKASVKANERLSITQMQAIVDQLLACEQPYTCPHGRPTMVRLEQADLERLFGRR